MLLFEFTHVNSKYPDLYLLYLFHCVSIEDQPVTSYVHVVPQVTTAEPKC